METIENKRRYFRILDSTDLTFRVIDDQDVVESSYVTSHISNPGTLAAALESVSQEAEKLLLRIEKKQPEIVQYLKLIDEKLDLLAQAVLPSGPIDNDTTAEINLSASGIAFPADEMLETGVVLELTLLLAPFRVMLVVCGRVIHGKSNPADSRHPYTISADFINLTEANRDLLIQHLVRRQMRQIREQKQM